MKYASCMYAGRAHVGTLFLRTCPADLAVRWNRRALDSKGFQVGPVPAPSSVSETHTVPMIQGKVLHVKLQVPDR